jgi:ribosomal protein S21
MFMFLMLTKPLAPWWGDWLEKKLGRRMLKIKQPTKVEEPQHTLPLFNPQVVRRLKTQCLLGNNLSNVRRRLLNEKKTMPNKSQKSATRKRKHLRGRKKPHLWLGEGKDPSSLHGVNPWPLFKQSIHGYLFFTSHEPTQRVVFNLPKHIWKEAAGRRDRKSDIVRPKHRQHSF